MAKAFWRRFMVPRAWVERLQRLQPPPEEHLRPLTAGEAHKEARARHVPPTWDERGYLSLHTDVATNVLAGLEASGYAHWLTCGYRERRALPHWPAPACLLPRALLAPCWDEAAYLRHNPHAEVLVALGLYADGLEHFWTVYPHQTPQLVAPSNWDEAGYLSLHEDIAASVAAGTFASGYHHWVRHGAVEGRLRLSQDAASARAAATADPATAPEAVGPSAETKVTLTHATKIYLALAAHFAEARGDRRAQLPDPAGQQACVDNAASAAVSSAPADAGPAATPDTGQVSPSVAANYAA